MCSVFVIVGIMYFFGFIVFTTVISRVYGVPLREVAVDIHRRFAQVNLLAGAV
jgi:hypothetical protein